MDTAGNAYIAGSTLSTDFPTVSALQPANAGGIDAFITRVNAAGTTFDFSTYYGGSGHDVFSALDLDSLGRIYAAGLTLSADFPTVSPFQGALSGTVDGVLVRLTGDGSTVELSTYFGCSGVDQIRALQVDGAGTVYLSGVTDSTDFPTTTSAFQASFAGGTGRDAFITKMDPDAPGTHVCGTPPPEAPTCNDTDGDGFGNPGDVSCPGGLATDCDDSTDQVFPGATEDCNGIDDNCDGQVDEGFDQDEDGFTTCGGDCDDTDTAVNPDATEVCDGVDNNCDNNVDEGFDADGDTVADCFDNCPDVANDQTDTDEDGAGDACDACPLDPLDDADGDGVCGDVDECADTVIPESVPTVELKPNRWALTNDDFDFDTVSKGQGNGPGRSYTTTDTAGCSCEQIIAAQGLGQGHTKHGCSISAMDDWVALVNQ